MLWKKAKTPPQRASCLVPSEYCVWYHSPVDFRACQTPVLKGTRGPSAPEICRSAPFVCTSPRPPHPTPTSKSTKLGEQGNLPHSPHFDKITVKKSHRNRDFRNCSKIPWIRLSGVCLMPKCAQCNVKGLRCSHLTFSGECVFFLNLL